MILFFCRRGREGQRNLKKKNSFNFEVDPASRNYTTMVQDEASKNYPGGVGDIPSMDKYARMYETEDTNDGFKALKLCLTKLNPNSEAFFQYPRKNWSSNLVNVTVHRKTNKKVMTRARYFSTLDKRNFL